MFDLITYLKSGKGIARLHIECFIFGRRSSGYFDLRTLSGASIHKSAGYKKLKLLEIKKSLLTERRACVSSHD